MDSYALSDHGVHSGPSHRPVLAHDDDLQQLQHSIQQQQQQLHQQLTSGTSSISDLIGMLPQTASLNSSMAMSSSSSSLTEHSLSHGVGGMSGHHHQSMAGYRSDSHGHGPLSDSPVYSSHSHVPLSDSPVYSSHGRHTESVLSPSHSEQSSSKSHDLERGDLGVSSIDYTRQGDSYVCSLCGKVVVSKAAITRHIQLTHEKKKPFECNICHRRFGYKNILLEHQNIHFGIKPYACTLCDKRFAARSNLFQHRLLHMKPFCCYVCNKRFDREEQMQRHLKLHPTVNALSCSQCPFTANSVETLNQHLQKSHKLLTYETRRHSSSFDSDSGDGPSQLVMSLPSPTLTSPETSPNPHMSLVSDSDTMRRIDSICSQLATRGQGHHEVKQEPLSPGAIRFTPTSSPHSFPPASPTREHLFSHSSPTSTSTSITHGHTVQHLPQYPASLTRSYSNPDPEHGSPLSMLACHKDMSPSHGMDCYGTKIHMPVSNPRFIPPTRRANSHGSLSPMGPLRHGGATSEHVQSIADSTSNLSEFFTSLQGLVHRCQEIPELHVSISGPKTSKDAGTQYNNTNLPGELPSLEDLLIHYESQGRLYRCQHCRISFEERGLYFLHKSLHGELSPWQCSICLKICADRNDFHLHFVNQQHRLEQGMH